MIFQRGLLNFMQIGVHIAKGSLRSSKSSLRMSGVSDFCSFKLHFFSVMLLHTSIFNWSLMHLDWRDIVVVAALDCADEMNTATCREFEVYGYPTLRFFPPNSPPHNVSKTKTDNNYSSSFESQLANLR